jgi:endonuclease YncB( thermonuclease family)
MPGADTIHGRVQRVKDGDTVVVSMGEGTVTVRIWGIDAPESDQPYGPYATQAVRKVAKGEPCRLIVRDRDRYGRVIGRVITTGERKLDVGLSLVHSGYAWACTRYASGTHNIQERVEEAHEEARQAGRGLWAQADPTPPWDYRSTEKEPTVWDGAKEGFRWGRWIWRLLRKL